MSGASYVFDGTKHDTELERLRLLESVFDPGTRRFLGATGLRAGMRCLEVGAGAGSVATWMAEEAGPSGRVAAVDIDTRFLANVQSATIEVHQADIRSVDLAPASFDLAHARFVFIHQADWWGALEATLRLLKPGGVLVIEEPDFSVSRALAGPPVLRQAFTNVHRAIQAMFAGRNMDYAFGLQLPSAMQDRGLGDMAFENEVPIVPGGAPFARMLGLSTLQLRDRYLETGLATTADIERYGAFASDASCWAIYQGTIRAAARKPA